MGTSPFEHVNIKQARRLLRAITDLARESSMTGSLDKGAKTAIRQYNGLLNHLSETGAVPEELFSELDENMDRFDDLGVACTLLNAYIDEDDDALPPMPPAPPNMVVHADSEELRELRELRDLLRERMPGK
jgi:hypothetical protein